MWRNRIVVIVVVFVFVWLSISHLSASEPVAHSAERGNLSQADMLRAIDDALAGRRYVEAGELLARLASQSADGDDDAHLMRAEWLIAIGRPAEAIPLLEGSTVEAQRQCRKLSAEMAAFVQTDEFDRAAELVAGGETNCAEDVTFWRGLGRLHLARDRAPEAVAAFRSALSLDRTNADLQGDLGVALIAASDPLEAVNVLSALLALDPDQAEARINLDYANGMLGRQPWRRPSDSDPEWSRRLQYAGLGAQRAGHLTLAEALLGQALIERPRHDQQLWEQYAVLTGRMDERRAH